ncbi:MAG: EamA family transporter [Candidatus Binatia bacterium]|nr:EamA family transporter [Candidatus Binatia bacterium]
MERAADQPLGLFPTLLMIVICAVWGGAFVAIKIGLFYMPPLGSAALRFVLTSLLLWLLARLQRVSLSCTRAEAVATASIALFLCYWNFTTYVGTGLTTAGRATVFFYTQPIFLALLAHYFLPGDRLTVKKIVGLGCALVGVVALFFAKLDTGGAPTLAGDLLVLSGALALAVQNLLIKKYAGTIHPLTLTFWGTVAAALVFALSSWQLESGHPFVFSRAAIMSLLYLSVISTAFGFVAFAWLLQRHSATRVTTLVFLTPVFGVLFGWSVLQETLTPVQLLGVAGVCAGVYIVSSSQPSQAPASLPKEAPARL